MAKKATKEPVAPVEDTAEVAAESSEGSAMIEGAFELIGVNKCQAGKFQPRRKFSKEEMDNLRASIKEHGVLQPVLLRTIEGKEGSFEIVAGERRWRAAKAAGLKEIPAMVRTLTDKDAAEIGIIENVQRSDLDPMAVALSYLQLMTEFSMTEERIAERVSRSVDVVTKTIKLTTLPEDVRDAISKGLLSASHGMELVDYAAFPQQCSIIAKQVISGEISVNKLKKGIPDGFALTKAGLAVNMSSNHPLLEDPDLKTAMFKVGGEYGSGVLCFRPDECARKMDEVMALREQEATKILQEAQEQGVQAFTAEAAQEIEHIALQSWVKVPKACTGECPCRGKMLNGEIEVPICLNPTRFKSLQDAEEETKRAAAAASAAKMKKKCDKAIDRLAGEDKSDRWAYIIGPLLLPRLMVATKKHCATAFEACGLEMPKELFQSTKKEPEKLARLATYTPDQIIEATLRALVLAELENSERYDGAPTPICGLVTATSAEQLSLLDKAPQKPNLAEEPAPKAAKPKAKAKAAPKKKNLTPKQAAEEAEAEDPFNGVVVPPDDKDFDDSDPFAGQ